MIELRINNVTLPIPTGLTINREFETTIFNREPEVSDFTLPIDLPLTDEAILALDFPHVIANPNVRREYDAELIIDGIYINRVTVRVLRTKLREKKCSISIIGNYGSFSRIVGDKKLHELTLGGPRLLGIGTPPAVIDYFNTWMGFAGNLHYQGTAAQSYIRQIAKGLIASDFLFPTCMDEKINLETGHTSNKTDEDVRSIINAYDYENDEFVDPILHYLNTVYSNDFFSSERHYWVPMFRLRYVLEQCFAEFGFSISGSILTVMETILIYNTYSINRASINYSYLGITGKVLVQNVGSVVVPQNHMPRWKVTDFITEIAKNFNLQFVIDFAGKTVTINSLNSLNGTRRDLSLIALPNPEVNFEKTEFQNGYRLAFRWDPEDGESGADVKDDIANYTQRPSVNTVSGLASIPTPAAFDIAYVKNLNAWYQYGGSEWFFYSHCLQELKTSTSDQLQQLETRIVPTNLKYINYSLQRNSSGFVKLEVKDTIIGPVSKMGMEGENMFCFDLKQISTGPLFTAKFPFRTETHRIAAVTNPHLLIWHGMQKRQDSLTGTEKYPMGSSSPYDPDGLTIGDKSLAWEDPEGWGLYPDFWAQFVARVAAALQVDYKVLMDAVTYTNLDLQQDIIIIDGLQFVCRKGKLKMPFPGIADLTLVRL